MTFARLLAKKATFVCVGLSSGLWLAAPVSAQMYGPPDRMTITRIMAASSMDLRDMNGDQAISDVDVSLMVLDRLVEKYGPDLSVGDVDGNGVENGEDMVAAIATIVRASFGKTALDEGPISETDVDIAVQGIRSQVPEADLNFDGEADARDVMVTIEAIGVEVDSAHDIDAASRELFAYIGAILTHGREYFMATEVAANTHLLGVSSTWPPNHPGWWPPNHTTGVSRSYEPPPRSPYHTVYDSQRNPGPPPHEKSVSRRWPANHQKAASETWLPPPNHGLLASLQGETPPPSHDYAVTRTWPTSHRHSASVTWPAHHDQTISRTWWPQHTAADSSSRTWPPMHDSGFSDTWTHGTQLSQSNWPPNHDTMISEGWGPTHNMNMSAMYPPGHVSYASNTWPGPQPLWPPGHTEALSRQWGEPSPNPWPPIFPPDHSWWTTFKDLHDVIPRLPWPMAGE
jgi:hypothetical protein